MKIVPVNPSDKTWCRHAYILWFGGCGTTYLLAYANDLESALEECAGWLADNAPGYFCDDYVAEEYKRMIAEGATEEEAIREARMDTTMLDRGHYLLSWEWGIVAEDVTPHQIRDIAKAS